LLFARSYPPERRPCAISDQVERVVALKRYQLDRDKIRVISEFTPCPPVWADENKIQQVLLNLVQNAHQALVRLTTDRVLTLRVRPRHDRVVIEVIDNGPGIPPEVLPRIFDPFFTTKPPGEGSGLGLSVSYGIIGQHGGRLYAENRSEGGAAFVVELPTGEAR
jgi:C4-dicarboxylate-specific signal transduction histidine kinase